MTATFRRPPARPGAILLVVLVLLTLFAIVGLSFALYAESEAAAARVKREGVEDIGPIDPLPCVNTFLGQFIYGTGDTGQATTSVLRGHDLATLMYGSHPTQANTTPYNGVGTFYENLTGGGYTGPADRRQVVNYSYLGNQPFIDPEFTGMRMPNQASSATWYTHTGSPVTPPTYVGKNAGYTYPDRNNMAVAVIDPATGRVLVPSFHRPSLFNPYRTTSGVVGPNPPAGADSWFAPPFATGLPHSLPNGYANTGRLDTGDDWTSLQGRYRILRPRPQEHPNFPYPPMNPDGSYTGDVQNWTFTEGLQRNDSIWLNANLPIFTRKGKRVMPLVAPLITPLDGRINLAVAGNLSNRRAATPAHSSNQGFGPWEQNLGTALRNRTTPLYDGPTEARRIVAHRAGNNQQWGQAANPSTQPTNTTDRMINPRGMPATPVAGSGLTVPVYTTAPTVAQFPNDYARVDWDGAKDAGGMSLGVRWPYPIGHFSDPDFVTPVSGDMPTTQWGNASTTATGESVAHPSLFNPYWWTGRAVSTTALPQGRTFTSADFFPQLIHYSSRPGRASDPSAESTVVSTATAESPAGMAADSFAGSWNALQNTRWTPPGDPSARVRLRVTPVSNSLNRPTWGPMTGDYTASNYQMTLRDPSSPFDPIANPYLPPYDANLLPTGDPRAGTPRTLSTNTTVSPPPTPPTTDYAAALTNRLGIRGALATLGAVDLNRPLADYRGNISAAAPALSATSVTDTTAPQAALDRQRLAADIFARLVFATGAYHDTATYNPSTRTFQFNPAIFTATPPVKADALRWLAQLAANIVDYIDNDDVSTTFVWNPAQMPPVPAAYNPLLDTNNFTAANALAQRVVFGVEKPRLALNEAYAEVANDPSDANGNAAFRVRLWYELINPANTPTAAGGPFNNNETTLHHITHSAYRVHVIYPRDGTDTTRLQATLAMLNGSTPQNVTGDIGTFDPNTELTHDYRDAVTPGLQTVAANNGQTPAGSPHPGVAVVGPQPPTGFPAAPNAYDPVANPPVAGASVIQIADPDPPPPPPPGDTSLPNTPLSYRVASMSIPEPREHLIVLRRLANPYLPPNDPNATLNPMGQPYDATKLPNPYITVDYLHHDVPAWDGVNRLTNMAHVPPPGPKQSAGRPQPLYGHREHRQLQTTADAGGPNVQTSFFRHNDGLTADTVTGAIQFDWFVHQDRPLVSQAELQHVTAWAVHELTRRTADPVSLTTPATATAAPPGSVDVLPIANRFRNTTNWTDPAGLLYRSLDFLTVKSHTRGMPAGGRVAGKVNVNMVWDKEVFRALLDPQPGNTFSTDPQLVDRLWRDLFAGGTNSRTRATTGTYPDQAPVPGGTRDEIDLPVSPATTVPNLTMVTVRGVTTYDRPFKGFGAGVFADAAPNDPVNPTQWTPQPNALPFGSGVDDTLLRRQPEGMPMPTAFRQALRYDPTQVTVPPMTPSLTLRHPHEESEPLRKLMNQLTTTSDTYLILMTFGYFEVTAETPDANGIVVPTLGKEVYDEEPGDTRGRFAAVVDRTHLAVAAPIPGQPVPVLPNAAAEPLWFTELVPPTGTANADYPVGSTTVRVTAQTRNPPPAVATVNDIGVWDNRVFFPFNGRQLRIGVGDFLATPTPTGNGETVAVSAATFDTATGVATLTVSATQVAHPAGSPVSNDIPGNPGPQAQFDPTALQNKGLVPLFVNLGRPR